MRIFSILMLFSIITASLAGLCFAQSETPDPAEFQEGTEYFRLPSPPTLLAPDDGKIEVTAFFWYGCRSCYQLDSKLEEWSQNLPGDVRLTILPMTAEPPMDVHARIFLTLGKMGLGKKAQQAVFDIFQIDRQPINVIEQLPELAQKLRVKESALKEAYNSADVDAQMQKLEKLMFLYQIEAVPSMAIDGKYIFDLGTAHGSTGYFALADRLIEECRQDRKAAQSK